MFIRGTSGNDTLNGTQQADIFNLSQGGNDEANGKDGHDAFRMGDAFTAADSIDGGSGRDAVVLDGNYANQLTLHADTLQNVEILRMKGGHDYDLATNDANVAAGKHLFVDALQVQSGDSLIFDGSAETDGHFHILGGHGDDILTGGSLSDSFEIWPGGDDTVNGGGGGDVFHAGHELTADDSVNGGEGNDTLIVRGHYNGLTFGEATLTSIEELLVRPGHDYIFTSSDATVAGEGTLTVNASKLHVNDSIKFNGGAETNGNFVFNGGHGDDVFRGGTGGDVFHGGGGGDGFTGGGGGDTYSYTSVNESTSTHYDRITDADMTNDTFLTPTPIEGFIGGVYGQQGSTLNAENFDSDLTALVGSNLLAFHADLFKADTGDLSSHVFMVIDQNGVTGYQAHADIVIDVTGFTGLDQ